MTVLPLDIEVILALDALPGRFHGDPADRLIVATARAHGLPLATGLAKPPFAPGEAVEAAPVTRVTTEPSDR